MSVPTIIVEGELASNILASGILTPMNGVSHGLWHVPGIEKHAGPSPIYEVARLLHDLTINSNITVLDGPPGQRIKIYRSSRTRREGN